jgi:hypothetical protein
VFRADAKGSSLPYKTARQMAVLPRGAAKSPATEQPGYTLFNLPETESY